MALMGKRGKARAPRYRVGGLSMVYDTGAEFWSGPVTDVSESGLFIETRHELPIGTRVSLLPDIDFDKEDALPFEVRAVVVRMNEYDLDRHFDRTPGLAFRLVNLTPSQVEQFRTFLMTHGAPVKE